MEIRILRLSKENCLFFNKFHLIFVLSFCAQNEKKNENISSVTVVISSLMVKF